MLEVMLCFAMILTPNLEDLDHYTAVESEKGVSFRTIKNFHVEKNKKMFFGVFSKYYLRCIALNHIKFYTFNKSFIIYLMMQFLFVKSIN